MVPWCKASWCPAACIERCERELLSRDRPVDTVVDTVDTVGHTVVDTVDTVGHAVVDTAVDTFDKTVDTAFGTDWAEDKSRR